MYSDLFEQLGAGSAPSARINRETAPSEPEPLVSFKAGKITMTPKEGSSSFLCVPDTSRGEVRLVWKDSDLQWQWYDRREKKVKSSLKVSEYSGSTFERIELIGKQHKDDRVYVWTRKAGDYDMYWMQDASEEKDDEVVATVNQYLADPKSAAPEGSNDMETEATANASNESSNQSQVDALSNILTNLGMPQSDAESAASGEGSSSRGGTLTLADLQGAMASIQSGPQQSSVSPSLTDIVTPDAITSLLENEDVRRRLIELLPEGQRTEEHLEANLRSPQVQQTLRSLNAALLPDDTGDMSGFYSVIANFNLDPADGQEALVANNPIQAFLDCILRSVEKEQDESNEEGKDEE